jgi:glycosidase
VWDEAKWDHDLRAYVQKCIALRKAHPALRRGTYHRLYAFDGVYVFGRWLGDEQLVIAFNASPQTRVCDVPVDALQLREGALVDVWNTATRWPITDGRVRHLKLAPRSGVALAKG